MAQKTPLTALTIDYADRWNGTWFAELSAFSYKLIEDYHLRFLITYFLRIKKQWLSLLSLNHSGGFLFFQIMACYAHAKVKSKSMLFPTQQGKVYLEDWQQQFENKINKLTIFQNLNADVWQKKLPVKKQNMWNYLHNTLLVQNTYNLSGTFFSALRQHATLSIWFDNKQVKSTLTLLSQPIANVLLTAQHNNNSLIYSIQQKFINCINSCKVIKAKMKYLQNVDWLVFLPMVYNSKKTKNYYSLYSVNKSFVEKNNVLKSKVTHMQLKKDLIQKRLFSQECRALVKLNNNYSLQICFSHINLQLKEFEVTRQQQLTAKKASVSSYKKKELTLHYFSKKKALYQTIYQSKSYLMRRIFAFKRYSSIKEGFQVFFKRFRFQFALKKTLIMLNTPLIFLAQALKRVTGLRQFFSYLPMNWSYQDYKPVKRYTIFERYGSKKYFVPTFVASHLTMSRGSPTVLVDLLVHKLRHEYQHTQFLSCVEKICRHLMAPPKSNTAYENVICKGIEILFTGKVNGSDRAKQWRFKLGPVHSSTFYTNTREEHAKVITKFGAFNLRFRMKLGSVGLRYLGSGLTFLLQHSFLFLSLKTFILGVLQIKCNYILILALPMFISFWEVFSFKVLNFLRFRSIYGVAQCDPFGPTGSVGPQEPKKGTMVQRALASRKAQRDLLTKEINFIEANPSAFLECNLPQGEYIAPSINTTDAWFQDYVNKVVRGVIADQSQENSPANIWLKHQITQNLIDAVQVAKSLGLPVTEDAIKVMAFDVVTKVTDDFQKPATKVKIRQWFLDIFLAEKATVHHKFHNFVVDNKHPVVGGIAFGVGGFVFRSQLQSGFKFCLNMVPTRIRSLFWPALVITAGTGVSVSILSMEKLPGITNSSTTVPGTEASTASSKSVSSEINKAIRTGGSRRYFSTGLKNAKQKYHKNLFIFFLIFIQIFIFFYFLDIFIWHYINTWAFLVLEGGSIFIMFQNSLEFVYASLSTNKYHVWNFMVGSTFANSILIVFMGLFFFNRNRTVLSDEDNLWLPQFLEKHSSWKDQWLFLNYFTWFNNLALIDQQLVRIILLKIWVYLFPFIMNLLFFRVFFWPYFLMGVAFMLYCQFLKFLVNFFYYITCTCLIKFFDIAEIYKHNFQQYFQILLTFTLFYNFLLLLLFFYLHLVAETAILAIISVFYFFYFIIFIFISYLYCVIYLLLYSLYFFLLFCFKINLHNLNQQELLLKKSKFFVCFCLLLFYAILIIYFNLI